MWQHEIQRFLPNVTFMQYLFYAGITDSSLADMAEYWIQSKNKVIQCGLKIFPSVFIADLKFIKFIISLGKAYNFKINCTNPD